MRRLPPIRRSTLSSACVTSDRQARRDAGPAGQGDARMSEERDTRSYSERYAPPPEPDTPPPPPSSGLLDGRLLAVVGVGFLAVAVVAALVLRGGSRTVPTAQATPSPTAPSTASAGPPPAPDPGVLALNRFW